MMYLREREMYADTGEITTVVYDVFEREMCADTGEITTVVYVQVSELLT